MLFRVILTVLVQFFIVSQVIGQDNIFNPIDFGAVADGKTLCTEFIQKAINECSDKGGGIVRLSEGQYLSGTLFLKNRVQLEIEEDVVLLGSADLKDYPKTNTKYDSYTDNYTERSLIYGENLQNISITGSGTIDFQGSGFQ